MSHVYYYDMPTCFIFLLMCLGYLSFICYQLYKCLLLCAWSFKLSQYLYNNKSKLNIKMGQFLHFYSSGEIYVEETSETFFFFFFLLFSFSNMTTSSLKSWYLPPPLLPFPLSLDVWFHI